MKKFALSLVIGLAAVVGVSSAASAYPVPVTTTPTEVPGETTVPPTLPAGSTDLTISDGTPAPGANFTATAEGCVSGEAVTFLFPGSTVAAVVTCIGGSGNTQTTTGSASATLTAPSAAGTYSGSATGTVTGSFGSFSIVVAGQTTATTAAPSPTPTVPGAGLPATGSDGLGTTTGIAIGLLIVGFGLFAVAGVRRRNGAVAA